MLSWAEARHPPRYSPAQRPQLCWLSMAIFLFHFPLLLVQRWIEEVNSMHNLPILTFQSLKLITKCSFNLVVWWIMWGFRIQYCNFEYCKWVGVYGELRLDVNVWVILLSIYLMLKLRIVVIYMWLCWMKFGDLLMDVREGAKKGVAHGLWECAHVN